MYRIICLVQKLCTLLHQSYETSTKYIQTEVKTRTMATEIIPIDSTLIEAWKQLYRRGDYSAIGRVCKVPHNYIMNAFESGQAEKSIYNAMKKFYQQRSDLLNSQKKEAKKLNNAA